MNDLATNLLVRIVKESLDDILWTSFHNTKSVMQSVIYSVIELAKLDLLRKDVTGKTLEAHIAKLINNDAAAKLL